MIESSAQMKLKPFSTLTDLENAVAGRVKVRRGGDQEIKYKLTKRQTEVFEEGKMRGYMTRGGDADEALGNAWWSWCEFSDRPYCVLRTGPKTWTYRYDLICSGKLEERIGGEFADRFDLIWRSFTPPLKRVLGAGSVTGDYPLRPEHAHAFAAAATRFLNDAKAGISMRRSVAGLVPLVAPPTDTLPSIIIKGRQVYIAEELQASIIELEESALSQAMELAGDIGGDMAELKNAVRIARTDRAYRIVTDGDEEMRSEHYLLKGFSYCMRGLLKREIKALLPELRRTIRSARLATPEEFKLCR